LYPRPILIRSKEEEVGGQGNQPLAAIHESITLAR
jgi:hypothetical protein